MHTKESKSFSELNSLSQLLHYIKIQIIGVIKIKHLVSHGTEWLRSAPAASTSFHAGPMCRDAAQRAVMLRKYSNLFVTSEVNIIMLVTSDKKDKMQSLPFSLSCSPRLSNSPETCFQGPF